MSDTTIQSTACGARCPHEAVAVCTLPKAHAGNHEDYGDHYPGSPSTKFRCTWKRTR
ncbi:hypothetical protein ACXET9_07165 [Brachybacterium sp. DNPG3]